MGLISLIRVNVLGVECGTVKVWVLEDFEKENCWPCSTDSESKESDDYYHLNIIETLLKIKTRRKKKKIEPK